MRFSSDERGQSIWIGFLFLVMFLLIALTVYQTTMVPDQIAAAEVDHAQAVHADMQLVGATVGALGKTGGVQAVPVDLAPEYPDRIIAQNPPTPTGYLRTTYNGNVTVTVGGDAVNLAALCGYGNDGAVPTRSLTFHAEYNRLQPAPRAVVGQGVVYREVGGTHLVDGGQSLVQNESIRLAPLATAYSESGTGVDGVRLVAGPIGKTGLNASVGQVRVAFPSGLPASNWSTLLANQPTVVGVEQVSPDRVAIVLEADRTYSLVCYGVGVGGPPPSGTRYLTASEASVTLGDHEPDPTIQNASAVLHSMNKHNESHVTVNWTATDIDGDLKSVTVKVVDLNETTTQSRTVTVSDSEASGDYTFLFGRGGQPEGTHYDVIVIAMDEAGNEVKVNRTVTTG